MPSQIRCFRCHRKFDIAFPEQKLCAFCRHQVIKSERRAARREHRKEISLVELELRYDQRNRAEWDVLMINEFDREEWASDIADRYRRELDARQRRDFRLIRKVD